MRCGHICQHKVSILQEIVRGKWRKKITDVTQTNNLIRDFKSHTGT